MYGKKSLLNVTQNSARPTGFMYAIERLQEERGQLMDEMKALYLAALEAGRQTKTETAMRMIRSLRARTSLFLKHLNEYLRWGGEELFPLVDDYFQQQPGPCMTPSYWGIEQDREMALLFIQSFMDMKLDPQEEDNAVKIRHATSHLAQACLIMQEYFRLEAEFLFPLADEILTDIDYFYS